MHGGRGGPEVHFLHEDLRDQIGAPTTAPPMMSLCPPRYLVVEWMTKSTP